MHYRLRLLRVVIAVLLLAGSAVAVSPVISVPSTGQAGAPAGSVSGIAKTAVNDVDEFVAPDSPRASLAAFLQFCRAGQ